ncbi:SLIT and NTRK-like protein 3 [Betta splendens]|uniref:SLIT and NTRK-like protein 3 n=1 Tax=Betta splendens TaxID=158456 RepID=A0A6P7L1Z1_BETSP|nr:SLIT and NTRK-like protein 3 [Betta splendens]XP_040924197.1 SLIT and NTRK-like protein 3 [Betta splendens]
MPTVMLAATGNPRRSSGSTDARASLNASPAVLRPRAGGMFCARGLLLALLLVTAGRVDACVCPDATVLSHFPSELPADACCLNFSGSALGRVRWSVFTNGTVVQTLDLSHCNISVVDMSGTESTALQRIYLHHNVIEALPGDFLARQPSLTEVDLSWNLLRELPDGFLRNSDSIEKLDLQGNQLQFLPSSVLQKPRLQRLELDSNPWDCSCLLLEGLEDGARANRTAQLQGLLGNLTCVSPRHLVGRTVWSLRLRDACRPPGLTALFIVLPLVILSALVLCWCCGRRSKEASVFGSSRKRSFSPNGQKQRGGPASAAGAGAAVQSEAGPRGSEGILKNQLLLRPASTLLGSSRDLYEEVEVKLGSAASTPRASSRCSGSTEGRPGSQGPNGAGRTELDTVSVTEVMKDSADREKAYLSQSTEYYSLVPGIELEDSDHGEYESVDLS